MRHHRLVERYLVEALGVPWDEVHEEAERWEHVLSEELEQRMDAALGFPTHDPHGDPIPDAELRAGHGDSTPLCATWSRRRRSRCSACPTGTRLCSAISPSSGSSPARRRGRAAEPFDGPVTVRVHSERPLDLPRAGRPHRGRALLKWRQARRGRARRTASPTSCPGEARVLEAAAALAAAASGAGCAGCWPFLGPAFIAAVAYVDPGNFATNIAAGAKYGYLLLWVILASNLMAMLIQTMSAKLGIATGHEPAGGLPRALPAHGLVRLLWVQAELIAMATDLAEFIGAALGLNLLFGIPLFPAGADHRRLRVRDPGAAGARASGSSRR